MAKWSYNNTTLATFASVTKPDFGGGFAIKPEA
ncbi:MAG: hypothetical protein GDYSWBUE_000470 [Candidatus Fervidibacterota bacterium]